MLVAKGAAPNPVTVGHPLTYSIAVINIDLAANNGVVLTDTLPAGVVFGSASTGCAANAVTVTCDLGSLSFNTPTTVTIVVTPMMAGTVTNTVTVAGDAFDPSLTNNTATASSLVREVQFVHLPLVFRAHAGAIQAASGVGLDERSRE